MKTYVQLFILFFTFFYSNSNAQEFKLGKVSVAELEEKQHPKDPSAAAAILFKKGEVKFEYTQSDGFTMFTDVKTRIKIYKKEGYDWANQNIRYYLSGNSKEIISVSDAVTYNLVNGKIEKTKLKTEGEFDENINKYWAQKKITLPNIKEGSVIEFQYTIKTKSIGSMREWDFQSSIPVNHSEFITYIPEFFVFNTNKKGFIFPKVTVKEINKVANYNYREKSVPGGTVIHSVSNETLEYVETQTTYLAENLPAMKDEAYVNNIRNYTASISHELSMTKFDNRPTKIYSLDWESVAKTIYEFEDFGLELSKSGYFEEDLKTVISGDKTRAETIGAIFNYVKTNIKWNEHYSFFCNDGVKTAYKNKTGNVAEINLMLTAMLRYAGFDANPVLVSTRSNGIALFPSLNAFNYVISAIETPEGLLLMDATEIFSTPNVLPLRDLNWFGRLIRKDGTSSQISLTPIMISKGTSTMNIVLNTDGTIDGKIRRQYTNHEALKFRKNNVDTKQESYLEKLENDNNGIEIGEYVRANELDLSKPVMETYSFKSNKDAEIISDKIYLSPMLFLADKENPFKQEKREYPVDFGYPFESKIYVNIDIPQGYKVEFLPKASNLLTGDDIGAFSYVIENTDNKIKIIVTATMNMAIVPADFYDVLKEFYQGMITKENEKIILTKNL
ncbi:transglutaminase [Flavobacterium alvei]|uniref:Transglutaminase n=1 Tax=Flavobacterium alvei TaxID=2080416 RepID=A0A2S5AD06_9FLAO|nr:DUF3857 domain-containing protein [Flavobacterium alvei]POY40461.1 transglutaminase [Flavobacterium alvei]